MQDPRWRWTLRFGPYIIWWAIAVHLVWGLALIIDVTVQPIVILVGLHWVLAFGVPGQLLGGCLIVAALMAAYGLFRDNKIPRRIGMLLLIPQYALMVAAFVSDTQSILTGTITASNTGQDAAGREIDRLLLLTALWPIMVASILHSLAIIERYVKWTRS